MSDLERAISDDTVLKEGFSKTRNQLLCTYGAKNDNRN